MSDPVVPPATLYRKKPIPLHVSQWFKMGDHPAVVAIPYAVPLPHQQGWGWVKTLEGGHLVSPGDWIITGVRGEHYACKPDIFAETYEPAAPVVPAAKRGEIVMETRPHDHHCGDCDKAEFAGITYAAAHAVVPAERPHPTIRERFEGLKYQAVTLGGFKLSEVRGSFTAQDISDLLDEIAVLQSNHCTVHPAPEPVNRHVEGYDAEFWHGSYVLLRDAILTHLEPFVHDDDVAEEAILVDAIEKAGAAASAADRVSALTSLEREWRAMATNALTEGGIPGDDGHSARWHAILICADELKALLDPAERPAK